MTAFSVAGTKSVSINGAALSYVDRGKGDSVVFVHGGYSDLRTWVNQINVFGENYHALAYSRRYARPNEDIAPGHDDQIGPHVHDLLTLLRQLDLAPAHLVGNSWGGFICLLAALEDPTAVRTLVLGEAPVLPLFVSNSPTAAELLRLFFRSPRDAAAIVHFAMTVVEPAGKAYRRGDLDEGTRIFLSGVLGSHAYKSLPEDRCWQIRENHTADSAQLLGAGFPPLNGNQVRSVRLPTLLVSGKNSPFVLRRTLTRRLQKLLPNVAHVEIANATHLMHEQNAADFNLAVLSFIGRH